MGLKDVPAIRISGAQARADPHKSVANVTIAGGAVILGYVQVHNHQPIALAGLLERALVARLDPNRLVSAIQARWALSRAGPDMYISLMLHAFDQNSGQT
jgi:hypothetical protein